MSQIIFHLARRKARISVNSTMRQARSLFSPKLLRHVRLALLEPSPFAGVEFEPRQSMKYRSGIDTAGLIEAANQVIRDHHPEAYKAFLLGGGRGAAKEVDLLEWSSFLWEHNALRIQPARFFHPKSEDSLGDLPVDAEVMALFRGYQKGSKGPFVIQSLRPPIVSASSLILFGLSRFAFSGDVARRLPPGKWRYRPTAKRFGPKRVIGNKTAK